MSLFVLIYFESKSSSTINGHLKNYVHTFVVIIFYLLTRYRALNKTKVTGSFETYRTTRRHVPEELHTTCCSSLSSFGTLTLQALLGHSPQNFFSLYDLYRRFIQIYFPVEVKILPRLYKIVFFLCCPFNAVLT